jgi:putative alpha-1,2-mannosidase
MSTYSAGVRNAVLNDIKNAPEFDEFGNQLSQRDRIIIRLEHYDAEFSYWDTRKNLYDLLAKIIASTRNDPMQSIKL